MGQVLEGGCLCGRVRYRAEGELTWTGHCHCGMCRRAGGAAYVTWFQVRSEHLHWTKGEPRTYVSSPKAVRQFCPDCGSPLTFRYNDKPHSVDVTAGSLDDPSLIQPKENVYWDDRIAGHIEIATLPIRKIGN